MDEFEQWQQKVGKNMFQTDEIIIDKLEAAQAEREAKSKAVEVMKRKRSIEPEAQASYRNLDAEVIDAATFRPEQPYFDPKAERRAHQEKFQKPKGRDQVPSKFERPDEIKLTSYEAQLKQRLQLEIAKREATKDTDQLFKEMAEGDDSSIFES